MTKIQEKYEKEVKKTLQDALKIKNVMAIPRLKKIVVNIGVKNATADKKSIEIVSDIIGQITGQKAKVTKAKQSISGFKLREGDKIGLVVTLRGKRMFDFFEKLVGVVLPRIKDFRGIKTTSFDTRGNYTLGLTEYSVFPEIDLGKVDRIQGLEMTIVTSSHDKEGAFLLLKNLGMPFKK